MIASTGKILLIEDNKETQLLIKVLLRDFYTLDISGDFAGSLKLLNEQKYSMVLLDINLMGNKDGIKILEFIRGNSMTSNLPVIIITAYEFSENEKKFLTDNSSAFITKPFEKESLLKTVKNNFNK